MFVVKFTSKTVEFHRNGLFLALPMELNAITYRPATNSMLLRSWIYNVNTVHSLLRGHDILTYLHQ